MLTHAHAILDPAFAGDRGMCPTCATSAAAGQQWEGAIVARPLSHFCSDFACAIGKGLIAGAAGTALMTAAQRVEMAATGRQPSNTPEMAGRKVLGVEPTNETNAKRLNTMVHWFYGTIWGVPLGLMSLFGVRGWVASVFHFCKIWTAGMLLLPAMKLSSPPWKWGAKSLAIDGAFHVVYAVGAGMCFSCLSRADGRRAV